MAGQELFMRVPKSLVTRLLASRGLIMKRVTLRDGKRMWVVSDGKLFKTLRGVWNEYK